MHSQEFEFLFYTWHLQTFVWSTITFASSERSLYNKHSKITIRYCSVPLIRPQEHSAYYTYS